MQGVQPTVWVIMVKNTEHKHKTKMFSVKNIPLEEDFLIILRRFPPSQLQHPSNLHNLVSFTFVV